MLHDILSWFSLIGSEFAHIGSKEIGLIFAIIIMDAALSGDNSIAISAMAQNLPEAQRNKAVWIGMSLAAVLRLIALSLAGFIMSNPWVQVLGGAYLGYLCIAHFVKEDGEDNHRPKSTLIGVLLAIGILDLSLSFDNVVAVVAMTKNMAVIFLGVMISIAMLAVATKATQYFMKKFPSLESAGYLILGLLSVVMLLDHTGEFIGWAYIKLGSTAPEWCEKITFHIGEVPEIIGVGLIVAGSICRDIFYKPDDPSVYGSQLAEATAKVAIIPNEKIILPRTVETPQFDTRITTRVVSNPDQS